MRSFALEIREIVGIIVQNSHLHGLWINTLSYLENCGARMISACEHPTLVKEEMLKHAAEEFRHALYLKQQLTRIGEPYPDYRISHLMGGWGSVHYLKKLNLKTSKYLRTLNLKNSQIKELSYLLVTYAIELRAEELYPIYQNALRVNHSKVQVQSILLEEKEHLREMEVALALIPNSSTHIEKICGFEGGLFQHWLINCQTLIH